MLPWEGTRAAGGAGRRRGPWDRIVEGGGSLSSGDTCRTLPARGDPGGAFPYPSPSPAPSSAARVGVVVALPTSAPSRSLSFHTALLASLHPTQAASPCVSFPTPCP